MSLPPHSVNPGESLPTSGDLIFNSFLDWTSGTTPSAFWPTKAAAAIRWKTVIGHRKLKGSLWAPEILSTLRLDDRLIDTIWTRTFAYLCRALCRAGPVFSAKFGLFSSRLLQGKMNNVHENSQNSLAMSSWMPQEKPSGQKQHCFFANWILIQSIKHTGKCFAHAAWACSKDQSPRIQQLKFLRQRVAAPSGHHFGWNCLRETDLYGMGLATECSLRVEHQKTYLAPRAHDSPKRSNMLNKYTHCIALLYIKSVLKAFEGEEAYRPTESSVSSARERASTVRQLVGANLGGLDPEALGCQLLAKNAKS